MDRLALLTALGVAMLFAQQVTPPDNPTATADQGSAAHTPKSSKHSRHRKSTPNANPNVPTDSSAPPTAPKTPVRPPDPTKPGNSTSPNGQHQEPGVPKPPAS